MCICDSLARACVCPHVCLVFGRVRLCGVCQTSEFKNNTNPSCSFPELVLSVGVNAACAPEPFYCHCDACPFITILFQRMICVSNWVFWSARRERYTIDKSDPKHQERQNSQSWAHKLHWGRIILYFAWGAPLFLLSFHLSYPKLTSECVGFEKLLVGLFIFLCD